MDEERTKTKGPGTRKLMTMHKAFHSKDDIDDMFQERKKEEDLPVSKIASMHEYKSSKTKSKERFIIAASYSNVNLRKYKKTKLKNKM